ncbi:hypothetical protein IWW39_001117 [Coemansia spiralis]|uniref:Tyrosinase copper-binding domain-containing protein n=1 Tax=Coemansia spiralis TaxID=417178 RepID=A0A9W8GQG9_9FUNG|nr:hypothetical protein IWW39_001117 [Coemansia spiralis]
MKFFNIALGLTLLGTFVADCMAVPPGAEFVPVCKKIGVRKEIRSLTATEWQAYSNAVAAAYNDKWIDWFGYYHSRVADVVHGSSQFLVFHRDFINSYEDILQGYNPDVMVPYWNMMVDFQNPANSSVLGSKYLGGNGVGANNCVNSGLAGTWSLFPKDRCLSRVYNNGTNINSWYSPEYVTSVMQRSNTYADFRFNIENSVHGAVHLGLNGDMGTMHSPTDPVFFLHHVNIDRLYAQWQAVKPATRTYMYDGVDSKSVPVTTNDSIIGTSTPVYAVMRLGYGKMCYTYDTIKAAKGDASALVKRQPRKCIKRPSPATQQIIMKLPPKVLAQFYPSFAKGPGHPLENEMATISPHQPMAADACAVDFKAPPPNENMRGKMPLPSGLPDDWIKMQGSSVAQVRALEKAAYDMVDALNKANYLSPYMV